MYVEAFGIAEQLGGATTAMDVAPFIDPEHAEHSACFWVQAAVNVLNGRAEYRRKQTDGQNDDLAAASRKRSKARALGRGG